MYNSSSLRFNTETGPGHTWWAGFYKRHRSELTQRKPDNLDQGRNRMCRQSVMDRYFSLLLTVLTTLGLRDEPTRIFNCDESGVSMDRRNGSVVVARNAKHAYSESKGTHVCQHPEPFSHQ